MNRRYSFLVMILCAIFLQRLFHFLLRPALRRLIPNRSAHLNGALLAHIVEAALKPSKAFPAATFLTSPFRLRSGLHEGSNSHRSPTTKRLPNFPPGAFVLRAAIFKS